MCFGSSPKPPDPIQTAQTQSNINTQALHTAAGLNQINQVNPFGSVSYTGAIGSPDRTQTTTLTPGVQNILDSQISLTGGLSDLANQRLAGAPRDDFSLSGAPPVRTAQGVNYATGFNAGPGAASTFNQGPGAQSSFNQGPAIQTGFDSGGALQKDIAAGNIASSFDQGGTALRGVDLSGVPQLRSDFENLAAQSRNAQYGKQTNFLDPQFQQEEQATRSRLAAQGITEGSQAYQTEMDNFARNKAGAYDQARNSAILSGDQLQNQLFGQSLAGRQQGVGEQFQAGNFSNAGLAQQFGMNQAGAQFANQAQQQGFQQNEARARLNNEATMMDYARNQGQASFNNAAAGQQFGQNQASAQFGNQAAAQTYAQNMGAAQFGNDAAAQNYAQNRGSAQFGNDALARQFSDGINLQQADQSNRSQNINESILGRNQNINEAMSFVNGAPIAPQNPTFQPFAQSTAAQAAPDVMGLTASNYNAQQQASGGLLGSIFGAAGRIGGAYAGRP